MKKLIVLVIMMSVFSIVGCSKTEESVKPSDMELATEYMNHEFGEDNYDVNIYESTDDHMKFIAYNDGKAYQGVYVNRTYAERIYEN